ncbi:hypothetical protein C8F01DRAFT_1086945 [Mycena amicta]|nr:hypothetical protein C8F01DRAFT_1086945 [Mycena amicta]
MSSSLVALCTRTRLARTRPSVVRTMHALHSPFGAMAPRALPPTHHSEAESTSSSGRINVVASPPSETFNGVPLGAYQVSTPYQTTQNSKPAKSNASATPSKA